MTSLSVLDWLVIAGFFALVATIGALASRGRETASQFFLADRRTPVFAAALSTIATALSAVTYIGAPAESYAGNLTYAAANLGVMLGALLVAAFFVPAFFRSGVASIYELLGRRFGEPAQRAASVMFLIGRTLANGVRLYVASIFVAALLFNGDSTWALVAGIMLTAAVATAYTVAGGIKAVIWTDCAQITVLALSILGAAFILLRQIDLPLPEILATLRDAPDADGLSKLTVIDTRVDLARPFTLASVLVGFTLFNAAAYGADQDLIQRTLTCRSAIRGSASLLLAIVLGAFVSTAFLLVGLLLYVRDARAGAIADDADSVFLRFILTDMPPGLRGLAVSGLLAASLATLDSALNAMSTSFVNDLVRPRRPGMTDDAQTRLARFGVVLAAAAVTAFALLCIPLREFTAESIIQFALGVMTYAYAGLLAVYFVALFTRRGSATSCIAAFAVGAAVIGALQFVPPLFDSVNDAGVVEHAPRVSLGWRMTFATACAFAVCLLGKGRRDAPR